MNILIRKNYLRILVLAVLAGLFAAAAQGMESQDFVITLLRGLSVGSLTFLVASGFSLIFGLLDVLNLAHGTLFMIGAYIGWTVYVRPDTFVDLLTPIALVLSGFLLGDVWTALSSRVLFQSRMKRVLPWVGLIVSALILFSVLRNYPISFWSLEDYSQSPVAIAYNAGQGIDVIPPPPLFETLSPWLAFFGLIAGSLLLAFSLSLFGGAKPIAPTVTWRSFIGFGVAVVAGILFFVFNNALTNALAGLNSNWRFLVAVIIAVTSGATLGALMETTLIRPLYVRPIYQLMLTLGLSAIGIEIVRAIWGRPEFTMPRPELFAAVGGDGCPATSLADWWQYHCSTMIVLEGRIRIYNEIFIPIVGLVVLVGVWILLQRSRLGMIIRAGVQDREMVEALGINVQRVFTQVFALGVGLAALGGILAAPSVGLSNSMGDSFFLNALFALAIGGLTSYPGAALGSLLVGLLQQFIIKYGQIGIPIPFTEIVFKPTPPIVPASTILLMVIILLILPNGLLGKKE
jgi:branched-chain amino acid transport system permease protein